MEDRCPVSVTTYPTAWRVEVINDDPHRGFEYVHFPLDIPRSLPALRIRIYWGTTWRALDIEWGSREDGAKVGCSPVLKSSAE
jgi:hypothetical protein